MLEAMLGRKVGMTSVFSEDGRMVPVTVIELGPCSVTQIRTEETDGYSAVQLGFGDRRESRTTKPLKGHFQKAGVEPRHFVREVSVDDASQYEPGQEITVEEFGEVKRVDVSGISKGKGFAGVMKRHGFKGGRASHGFKWHRKPGSIGQSATPARTIKGVGMPGQMGNKNRTNRNLRVHEIIADRNLILIEGNVPGGRNGFVVVRRSERER
ncbi:MAG: 50S ribosomal protein L3 [Planctomycetota bacterium]|nr:50S ribosomal protein L3 [Planctomycetota bacterium]